MDVIELIGFLIAMFSMAFIFLRQLWLAWYRNKHPAEYEAAMQKRESQIRELMSGVPMDNNDVHPEKHSKSQKHKKKRDKHQLEHEQISKPKFIQPIPPTPFSQKEVKFKPIDKAYDIKKVTHTTSKARKIVDRIPSLKTMVILSEVYGPPKSFK